MNTALVQRWFERIRGSVSDGTYTFQTSFHHRRSSAEGAARPLQLSSYDYLGLLGHPQIEAAAIRAIEEYGTGAGGVRLLTGTNALHTELEDSLAQFKETEAAIVLDSGYAANLAAVASLFGPRDAVFADERAHRSLLDACRLAGSRLVRFAHNDLASLDELLSQESRNERKLIAVEGVYSMDGDVCPLPELVELKRRHGAFLLVDEAHALGVLGNTGRGTHEHFGIRATDVELWTGSLSKAIPSNGGFIAASQAAIVFLQHAAAPFMFSAALGPPATATAIASLAVLRAEPERTRLLSLNAERLRSGLRGIGFDLGATETPLIPVILGEDGAALELAKRLRERGIFTSAVVSPAVPAGAARLRLCATARHGESELDRALEAFAQLYETSLLCGR